MPEVSIYCPDRDHDRRHQSYSQFDIKKAFVAGNAPLHSDKGILVAPTRFGRTYRPETFASYREGVTLNAVEPKQRDVLSSKVGFQADDKQRKLRRDNAVAARKQGSLLRYEESLADEVTRRKEQDRMRVEKKAQRLLLYEAMNH